MWLGMEEIRQKGGTRLSNFPKKSSQKLSPLSIASAEKEVLILKRNLLLVQLNPEEWKEMVRKAEVLTRKKDFLHLLCSSQPESVKYARFEELRNNISHTNQQLRELNPLQCNYVKPKEFQAVERNKNAIKKWIDNGFQDIERSLSYVNSGIWAFLPQEDDIMSSDKSLTQKMEVGLTPRTSGDEMLEMAIDSAIRQVSKCIKDGIFRKIGISGSGGEKVAYILKDIPVIRAECSVVLQVFVSRHHNIKQVRQNIATQIGKFRFCKTDYISEGSRDQYFPYKVLLLVDCEGGQIDLHDLEIPDRGFLVLTTRSQKVYDIMDLDLEIKMEDHLLPWELFCRNVGPSLVSSSDIQQMAIQLVKECHGHLRAIVLLARALKGVTDIGVWKLALYQLTSQSSYKQVRGMSQIMVRVLELIWDQKDIITKRCIKNCTHHLEWRANALVSDWIQHGLVKTQEEGKIILEELISSFLLEIVDNGCVRMQEETNIVLRKYFIPSLLLRQGGLGLTETPKVGEWINAMEIELMNNKLSELPENPKCQFLQKLLLHNNYDLMEIPPLFFKDMTPLTCLDLSYTSIKSLPPSISNLVSLRKFYLRGCELLMELSPQIGALRNLEVFDLEGTEIMYLPEEIGKLISLTHLKVSFCGHANCYRETKPIDTTIPTRVLSKLYGLRELSIDVNPDAEWWDVDIKVVLNEVSSCKWLKTLELYLPSVELLQQLIGDNTKLLYSDLAQFRFMVGHHRQRIISRLPHEVEKMFKKWKKQNKCLEYVNGEGIPIEIMEALNHATVFFLDRHWTIKMLSEFGNQNMVKLNICLLVECNELETIIDGYNEYPSGVDKKHVFEWLQYLSIHYMKNLQSIWKGPIDKACLSNLRFLALHTCPNLTTIFTPDLLANLNKLEELVVQDCCKIRSLVNWEPSSLKSSYAFQRLGKISLLNLPELVSILGGLSIGPRLRSLIVYNCPKLKNLYALEVCSNHLMIKGEKEWWDAVKWHKSKLKNSVQPAFKKLGSGEDVMDELAKDIYSHQHWLYF